MQVEVKKIIKYCEEYLKTDKWQDYCHNGLQVEGAFRVNKIITGVSFSQALIEEAIKKRAKMIMVHHGIFKAEIPSSPQIKGVLRNRLKMLLENNINLAGFHLPLDAHSVIGNNISLIKLLGLKEAEAIKSPDHGEIGFIGEYKETMKFSDFKNLLSARLESELYVIPAGPSYVKRVGIISGGASPDFQIAKEMGADTYICGDIREGVVRAIEESKLNFINAGHYNTEKLGIQNLGNLVAKKFSIKHEFIDIPCDV
ncbi:Nif3-like dinuclear metal center hexameric protein [Candidatus Parcubacteria bacterium]|nr:Nif3-like dinuclear metal center hexameric protein [Candidatus Parcubacteria bacterium]